jgi:hypothetical protein
MTPTHCPGFFLEPHEKGTGLEILGAEVAAKSAGLGPSHYLGQKNRPTGARADQRLSR